MEVVEPEINSLRTKTGRQLDRITILSSSKLGTDAPDAAESKGLADAPEAASPHNSTPAAGGPKKRRPRKKAGASYLQVDELERLFRAISDPRDRAIFRLAYHAGLRASEVGLLELRDYNPRTERIYIHALKGSNSGEHHLCREEQKALRAWLKTRGSEPGPIFLSRNHRPISRKQLHELMRVYCRLAMIPPALSHFHVLKHSCATHLAAKGFGVEQIQDWIRHANIQNTMGYMKITNARRDQMAAALKDSWR